MRKTGFIGSEDLIGKLKSMANTKEVDKIIKEHTQQMAAKSQRNALNFKGHYKGKKFIKPTGTLRRSMKIDIKEPMRGVVEYTEDYGGYVEYGTRHMEAQPFLIPAYQEEKENLKRDLRKLIR